MMPAGPRSLFNSSFFPLFFRLGLRDRREVFFSCEERGGGRRSPLLFFSLNVPFLVVRLIKVKQSHTGFIFLPFPPTGFIPKGREELRPLSPFQKGQTERREDKDPSSRARRKRGLPHFRRYLPLDKVEGILCFFFGGHEFNFLLSLPPPIVKVDDPSFDGFALPAIFGEDWRKRERISLSPPPPPFPFYSGFLFFRKETAI